jgi:DNA replication protein DnaC
VSDRGKRYELCQLSEFLIGNDEYSASRKQAVDKVKDFCEQLETGNVKRNLIFAGPSGSGKDHLMFYALRYAVMKCGVKANWTDGLAFFSRLRDAISTNTSEYDVMKEMYRPEILAISDPVPPIGQLSDHQRNMLYRLIDERYSHCKPIWITVNAANPRELDERMGVQLVDRLLHDAVAVNCYWPSHRRTRL